MDQEKLRHLQSAALRVRERVIKLSGKGGCFIGASLSCADLIVYLYREFLRIDRDRLQDPGRDYFLLSKGHDVPALYGAFVELGWLPEERLANHVQTNDCLYWHPNRGVPGIEFHSGSLGHLLSVAAGIALDCKGATGSWSCWAMVSWTRARSGKGCWWRRRSAWTTCSSWWTATNCRPTCARRD